MSYALYVLGFLVVIGGIAWAATLAGVPQLWIIIGVVILLGIAIMAVASRMSEREPPPRQPPVA